MANPLPEPSRSPTSGLLGPDPGRSIRIWVTMLLRLGIGLSLLSTGLAGYFDFAMRPGGATGPGGLFAQGNALSMLDPFLSGLPYLAIGLGLALILGFLTTASSIGAGFFSLILPIFAVIHIVATGSARGGLTGPWGNDPFLSMLSTSLPNLLTNAAMIWLSPLENNPFSVDALIFGREEIEPESFPTPAGISDAPEPIVVDEAPLQIGE
jgi:uncharacterized membrane protein YphA (DoxX/SURF4 family)